MDQVTGDVSGGGVVLLALALLIIISLWLGVRIVPQSEQHVVERFGRLHKVISPGINFIVPFLDRVAHRVSVLERQLPTRKLDAITADNVLLKVEISVFYRILAPERSVYRIRDVDNAIDTTVSGIVRAEIGRMELDQVQANRAELIERIRQALADVVDDWGIEVTRVEILDVDLDQATREAMLQQLNAERARRALVTEAEGKRRAIELEADARLYAAEQEAKARRIQAEAEAEATRMVAKALSAEGLHGLDAARYQVALKQVEAIGAMASGEGRQTILVPAEALSAFADAFRRLGGGAPGEGGA